MHARLAGVLVPLFSLNREADLGRGDIGALPLMAEMAVAMGHRLIQMLPNDETAPGESSPYSAISVFAIDPTYIAADQLGLAAASINAARRKLGIDRHPISARTIERGRLYPVTIRLLQAAYGRFRTRADSAERREFDRFVETNQYWLEDYALFRALKRRFRWREWYRWPSGLRDHDPAAMAQVFKAQADEIAAYQYWQFIAQRQWDRVRAALRAMDVALGGDLAFSPGRDSAEVWANQQLFDLTRSVGAPPDAFSVNGQRWGLPNPNWEAMRADGFAFVRARVRHARDLFDILRIDHVVGLYRTYSFADDAPLAGKGRFDPPEETLQLRHGEEVIRAIQMEAGPMGLIAEDLGMVPPFVRKSLTSLGVPGYKVMRWEKENWNQPDEHFISPAEYPELSLATTGTHDTESLQSWWRALSLNERKQLLEALHLDDVQPDGYFGHKMREAMIEALYAAPSRLAITPLQDLLGWSSRINTPGTVGPRNWRWRIPCPLERMMASASVRMRLQRLRTLVQRTGRI